MKALKLVCIGLVYFILLNKFGLAITGDQKTYLATTLEMLERSEYFKPFLQDVPSYLKPPFQYWVTLLSLKFGKFLTGEEFQMYFALLPSAIALVLSCYFISEVSIGLGIRKKRVYSDLILATTLGAFIYAHVAQMEIWVILFYCASWWAALRYLVPWNYSYTFQKPQYGQIRYLYIALIFAGLSALNKSPLYSVFWVLSFWIFAFVGGYWSLFWNRHFYFSHLIGIFVGLSWYLYILAVDGSAFWSQYVVQETLNKSGGNEGSLLSLVLAFLYQAFPYCLLLPLVFVPLFKRRANAFLNKFVVSWAIPPFVFFALHPYKVGTYFLILLPAFCLLVDWMIYRLGRGRLFRVSFSICTLSFFVALTIIQFLNWRVFSSGVPYLFFTILLAVIVIAWVYYAKYDYVFLALLAGIVLVKPVLGNVHHSEYYSANENLRSYSLSCKFLYSLNSEKDIWNDWALVGLSLKIPSKSFISKNEMLMQLQEKNTCAMLSEGQFQKIFPENDIRIQKFEWFRFGKRKEIKVGFRDILLNPQYSFEKLKMRKYFIISLSLPN